MILFMLKFRTTDLDPKEMRLQKTQYIRSCLESTVRRATQKLRAHHPHFIKTKLRPRGSGSRSPDPSPALQPKLGRGQDAAGEAASKGLV